MEKVRIQDNLYNYVNQKKLDKLVIPDDKPTTGGFSELAESVEKIMMGEFRAMAENKSYPNDYIKRAVELYSMAIDGERRTKHGIAPALESLAILDEIKTTKDFSRLYKTLFLKGIPTPIYVDVDTDMKDSSRHLAYIVGANVILPDASYYKPEREAQKVSLLGMWSKFAKEILAKTNLTAEEQEVYIKDTLAFDEILGSLVKTREEWSRYIESYNPFEEEKVAEMVNTIDFDAILKDLFGHIPSTIVVTEPRYFGAFTKVFNEETLTVYKHWAFVIGLLKVCSFLSEELRDLGGAFMRALTGVATMRSIDKFAYGIASEAFSEPVGIYYGEKYFGEEAKKDITEIVYQIIDTYKERIKTNEILGDETKERAILKLSKIGVKMGYPDKVDEDYNLLTFDENASLFDAVCSLRKIKRVCGFSKLTKDVNREEWPMPGHMVNACYNPSVNDITFPAAILQAPFYSIKQTRSENLGGIGAVIAHEISHAFDSNGAKCDENGNLHNWWTKEDTRKFNAKIKAMIKEFDGIELPWGRVNGKFIVSENIADNGGMAVTLEIMSKTEGASYEEYFMNWARVWCQKAKPEYRQLLLSVDVHGPAILRANMQPRNFPEWYSTFNVKRTDKMYLAPSKRVIIW